jgi:hypothetical protein
MTWGQRVTGFSLTEILAVGAQWKQLDCLEHSSVMGVSVLGITAPIGGALPTAAWETVLRAGETVQRSNMSATACFTVWKKMDKDV